ncbi:MAG: lipoprotein-releasing ABC transporter ATP-binding protein LolD [Porticoccaceae bacterium]
MSEQQSAKNNNVTLAARSVRKSYQQGPEEVVVLDGLELKVTRGELLGVVGASGSGKSTLLNLLGGLDRPDQGSIEILGRDLAVLSESQRAQVRNQHLGFVYQFHHLLGEFSALENAAMPLLIAGKPKREIQERAQELLVAVGLEHRLKHRPSALSGGERQRVAIARALANHPDCVLMDEPTGNLDRRTADQVLELLLDLNQRLQISFVIVSHDERVAARMDRVVTLDNGALENTTPVNNAVSRASS